MATKHIPNKPGVDGSPENGQNNSGTMVNIAADALCRRSDYTYGHQFSGNWIPSGGIIGGYPASGTEIGYQSRGEAVAGKRRGTHRVRWPFVQGHTVIPNKEIQGEFTPVGPRWPIGGTSLGRDKTLERLQRALVLLDAYVLWQLQAVTR
jgi:hypothetical protein